MTGHDVVICSLNDTIPTWTKKPTCELINCGPFPYVPHSSNTSSGTFYNDTVSYKCHLGYRMIGGSNITCSENGWSDKTPTCEIVNCSYPGKLKNGSETYNNVSYGSLVSYYCNLGFFMTGNSNATCRADGNWTAAPNCTIKDCGNIPNVSNANHTGNKTHYKSNVTYQCHPGYTLAGANTTYCLSNGSWTVPPRCLIKDCGNIPNVSSANHTGNKTHYNSQVTFQCHPGYTLAGNDTIYCLSNGSWTAPPNCFIPAPTTCGEPPKVEHAERENLNNTVSVIGAVVVFLCQSGYRMTGKDTVRCRPDGAWDPLPNCTIVNCGNDVPFVPNAKTEHKSSGETAGDVDVNARDPVSSSGTLQGTSTTSSSTTVTESTTSTLGNGSMINATSSSSINTTTTTISTSTFTITSTAATTSGLTSVPPTVYGSVVYYTCEPGYQMATSHNNVTCLASGNWSTPPACQKLDCKSAPHIDHANKISENEDTLFNSVVQYECIEGYVFSSDISNVTCNSTGAWSQSPHCEIKNCGTIPTVMNAVISGHGRLLTTFGAVVNYTCITGHNFTSDFTSVTCNADGQWSQLPTCTIIDCGEVPVVPHSITVGGTSLTTYQSTVTFACLSGFIQSGQDVITCQKDGRWSGFGPTCIVSTTTPAPTQMPCTKTIDYMQNPEKEVNMTMNSTETETQIVSHIWCKSSGYAQMTVVLGCAFANKSAGFIWWDAFCVTRPRRRRPPIVTGPVIVRPQYAPAEAPAAVVIGTVELAIALAVIGFIVFMDLITLSRHIAIMKANLRAWAANGYKRTPYPIKVKPAKSGTSINFSSPSSSAPSTSPLTRPSTKQQFQVPINPATAKTPSLNERPPPYACVSPTSTHVSTNTAVSGPSVSAVNSNPWKSAMALRRTQQAFRSARSKPVDKAQGREMNKEMVNRWQDLHVPPEFFFLPNGSKAKKVYLA